MHPGAAGFRLTVQKKAKRRAEADMKSPARWKLPVLSLAVALQPAFAFEYPLSSGAISEAYSLARGDAEKRDTFFEKYTHQLSQPPSGAYVAWIEVETPFSCVADAIAHAPFSYHEQDAEQDYLAKAGCFRVRVEIHFTSTYPDPTYIKTMPTAFWNDFTIQLRQKHEIQPRSKIGWPIYSDETQSGYLGADVTADYNADKIDPDALTTVDVVAPDGQDVQTTFDLSDLR